MSRTRLRDDAMEVMAYLNRLRALIRTYQEADSIIALKDIRAELVNVADEAPAWTSADGNTIHFNARMLGTLDSKADYVRITGLNYHELSHVLFTPMRHPRHAVLYSRIDEPGQRGQEFMSAFNALEDQRIESNMVVKAPSVTPYFQSMIASYILSNERTLGISYLMVYGRKYLGQAVIEEARRVWEYTPEDMAEGERIIDEYRLLNLTEADDLLRAVVLIAEFMELLRRLAPEADPNFGHGDHNHGGASSTDQGDRKLNQRTSRAVALGKDDPERKAAGQKKDDGQGQGGSGDEKGEDEPEGAGKQAGEGDGDEDAPGAMGGDQDGDDIGDEEEGGKGAGNKPGEHGPGTTFEDLLRAMLDTAVDSYQVEMAYNSFRATVKAGRIGASGLPRSPWWDSGSLPEATMLVRRVTQELTRLVEKADPGWSYRESAGRFNVQRYAMGERDIEQLFDEWEEGNTDATSIEVVVLLDISGSVDAWADVLSGVAWVVKRSCDQIEVPCTVIVYDTEGYYVYNNQERAGTVRFPSFECTGGTDPTNALYEAYAILGASQKKKRYLLTMTDGVWQMSPSSRTHAAVQYRGANTSTEEIVETIGSLPGCLTQMVYYDPSGRAVPKQINWRGHQQRVVINNLTQLPLVFRSAMSALLQARR